MTVDSKQMYKMLFKEYPDILDVEQTSEILGVCKKTVYKLIKDAMLPSMKIGRLHRVPKIAVIQYFFSVTENVPSSEEINESI